MLMQRFRGVLQSHPLYDSHKSSEASLRAHNAHKLINASATSPVNTPLCSPNNTLFYLSSLWVALDITLFCLLHHFPQSQPSFSVFFVPCMLKAYQNVLLLSSFVKHFHLSPAIRQHDLSA